MIEKALFNPFEDRLSRDIRNTLSSGLAEAIETGNGESLLSLLKKYQKKKLPDYCSDYIEDRYMRYTQALEALSTGENNPIRRGLILWDLELFFEVHEVLEHAWYTAEGKMKETLQALIRAAGVYIKLEYGYIPQAEKIAEKSRNVLLKNRSLLQHYFEPDKLISALTRLQTSPPKLLG
jgi:hypothetical protein